MIYANNYNILPEEIKNGIEFTKPITIHGKSFFLKLQNHYF